LTTRIGVDIGGTFTDLVIYDEATGRIELGKIATTPANPERGCVGAIRRFVPPDIIRTADYFLHGTTVGLNALLERRGATVGLLYTEGFRDSLEIRRGTRPEGYSLFWVPPEPIVPRYLRLPVRERIGADGDVLQGVDSNSVREALQTFRKHNVTAIAICLLNSYRNSAHELEVLRILREAGYDGEASVSHQLSREYRDYERTSTTCIDAFVRARMSNYLDRVISDLRGLEFKGHCLITRSGGGSMTFAEARERSFETINSGPVAGAEGAAELSRHAQLGDLVTADVGGTSFDTTVILNGRPKLLYQGSVGHMPIQAPWVDVRSIGAGGGSIAYIDAGDLLQVGPRSAGAVPGPACYGRGGTEPTVTDAALFLGLLGTGRFSSGLMLDRPLAELSMRSIAGPLECSAREAAAGIIRIAATNMANAVREITIEEGLDPRQLKLLAFGGAGPMLCTQIARELSMSHVVVPPIAGNFSAWGLLGSDLVRSVSATEHHPLDERSLPAINESICNLFSGLLARGEIDDDFVKYAVREVGLGLRYKGQEHSLTVAVPFEDNRLQADVEAVRRDFLTAYERSFGIVLTSEVEVIAVRCALRKHLPRRSHTFETTAPLGTASERITVYSFARNTDVQAPLFERDQLVIDRSYDGPAVINEPTATTFVDTDFRFHIDPYGCLHLVSAGDLS
jgi:N-methylhydantoinase A